jgi:hypothetical protein
VIEWPTRHDGPKTIKIAHTANQRESRADRPEPPKRPAEEATSNYLNFLDRDQAADPNSSRTITGEVPDDLGLVPNDGDPDDAAFSRTIPARSVEQPSSGSSGLKTNANSPSKDGISAPDDSYGAISNFGSTYPEEPPQGDGVDDDDWRDGGGGFL